MHYYKFRSLENIKRFLDILISERLYAARYDKLNDPMEGSYLVDSHNKEIIRLLKVRKYNTRICSLSRDYKHTLLWTHYADEHMGCCIEVGVTSNAVLADVNYVSELPFVKSGESEAITLLSHKSKLWEYEQESRIFSKSAYCKVKINRVIFGFKVSDSDYEFYRKLINAINPYIMVCKIKESEIYTGFIN